MERALALGGQLPDDDAYHVVLFYDGDGDDRSGVVFTDGAKRYITLDSDLAVTLRPTTRPSDWL